MNSPVQKGDRHARVAEPIPRPMVLQILLILLTQVTPRYSVRGRGRVPPDVGRVRSSVRYRGGLRRVPRTPALALRLSVPPLWKRQGVATSMLVAMKQRYACSGAQTIGSPRTLKLVLMSTGQPVRDSNARSSAAKRACRTTSTVCTRAE